MKFKYLDKVIVKDGFFKGVIGRAIDYYYSTEYQYNLANPYSVIKYRVTISTGDIHIKEEELELVEEGAIAGAR